MTDSRTPGVEPPVQHRAPLPPIRFADLAKALLDQAATLLPQWLPDGTQRGHEYVCAGISGGRDCTTSGASGDREKAPITAILYR